MIPCLIDEELTLYLVIDRHDGSLIVITSDQQEAVDTHRDYPDTFYQEAPVNVQVLFNSYTNDQ